MYKRYISSDLVRIIKLFLKKIFFFKIKFSVSDFPLLDKISLDYFCKEVENCSYYMEYGSGGSTIYVAKKNIKILSIENDYEFYKFLSNKLSSEMLNANLIYANTGLVGSYGIPINKNPTKKSLENWKNYVKIPWEILEDEKPDLVFIDGRFRVACALYSIIQMKDMPGTKILIDDYSFRPEYSIIEKFSDFKGIRGRMGVFEIPKTIDKEIYKVIDQYFKNWL